jgi:hypothetical protein
MIAGKTDEVIENPVFHANRTQPHVRESDFVGTDRDSIQVIYDAFQNFW